MSASSTSSSTSSASSTSTSTPWSFWNLGKNGRYASPLVDWSGMKLLQHYIDMKSGNKSSIPPGFDVLEATIKKCWTRDDIIMKNKAELTKQLATAIAPCFGNNTHFGDLIVEPGCIVNEEMVYNWCVEEPRAVIDCATDVVLLNNSGKSVSVLKIVVNGNGSCDDEIGQALDYATLLSRKQEKPINGTRYAVVWTLHMKRTVKGEPSFVRGVNVDVFLAEITEEDDCSKARFAFLWREHCESNCPTPSQEEQERIIEKSCGAIARAVCTVAEFTRLKNADNSANYRCWRPMGDNCSHCENNDGTELVYKIFDNRFAPTYRSPDVWLAPGIVHSDFYVKECLHYSEDPEAEDSNRAKLGFPDRDNDGLEYSWVKRVDFGFGCVTIISYKFMKGTHMPKIVKPFIAIAEQLYVLHKRRFVHGDVRLFNMLFEDGESPQKGWLLDYDYSGKLGHRQYPSGYAEYHTDVGLRAGKGLQQIRIQDDWHDFICVLDLVEPKNAWEEIRTSERLTETQYLEYFVKPHAKWRLILSEHFEQPFDDSFDEETFVPNLLRELKELEMQRLTLKSYALRHELQPLSVESQGNKKEIVTGTNTGTKEPNDEEGF